MREDAFPMWEAAAGVEDVTPAGQAVGSELDINSVERLIFFSDAVVAIAITLLALDLHPPGGSTNAEFWHNMRKDLNSYLGFLISFMVIGGHWFSHHRMFGYVTRLDSRLARWNMLWLLTIVLTPFATRVIVDDGAFAARLTLYALVQASASIFFFLAVYEMDRHNLVREGTPRALFTRGYRRISVVAGAFLVSIPMAYVIGRGAFLWWVAIPFLTNIQSLISDRWHRRGPAHSR
jgi:uncharacterized membrane protein